MQRCRWSGLGFVDAGEPFDRFVDRELADYIGTNVVFCLFVFFVCSL